MLARIRSRSTVASPLKRISTERTTGPVAGARDGASSAAGGGVREGKAWACSRAGMASAQAKGAKERRGRTALARRAGTEQADGFIVKKGTGLEEDDASGKSGRP